MNEFGRSRSHGDRTRPRASQKRARIGGVLTLLGLLISVISLVTNAGSASAGIVPGTTTTGGMPQCAAGSTAVTFTITESTAGEQPPTPSTTPAGYTLRVTRLNTPGQPTFTLTGVTKNTTPPVPQVVTSIGFLDNSTPDKHGYVFVPTDPFGNKTDTFQAVGGTITIGALTTVMVCVADPVSQMSVTKTRSTATYAAVGQTITYTIVVTNTGNEIGRAHV